MSTDHQNAPQITVTLLGDRPELAFAAGRILAWHKPNPSRKIAPRPERLRVRDGSRNGGRANNADPGNSAEPFACLVRAMLRHNPLLDRSNERLQRLKLGRKYDEAYPSVDRQAFIAFICNHCQQLLEPFAPLRRRNTELAEMCA